MTTSVPPNLTVSVGQLTKDQATCVDLFTARWSLAEFSLLMPVMRATNVTQEVAAVLLAKIASVGAKIDVAQSVVAASSLINQKQKDEMNKAINTLKSLVKYRNIVAHHVWAIGADGNAYTIDHRKLDGDPKRTKRWSTDDVKKLCNQTLQAAHEICVSSGASWIDENAVKALTLGVANWKFLVH